MFILCKLVLAHLIADFILQFEELFRLKLRSFLGHFFHALMHAVVSLAILLPYLGNPFIWIFVITLSVVHMLQDLAKYSLMENKRYFFLIFLADQMLHVLALSTILLFPVGGQVLGFPAHPRLDYFYTENEWTLYAIAFLISTFCGTFLFNAYSWSYVPNARKDRFITTFESVHGLVERGLLTCIFLFSSNPAVLVLSPAVGLIRLFVPPLKSKTEFLASFIYGTWTGILFRLWA